MKPDPKYPIPRWEGYPQTPLPGALQEKLNDLANTLVMGEEFSEKRTVFSDGRPVLISQDQDEITDHWSRNFLYSVIGLENWSDDDHWRYLVENDAVPDRPELRRSLYVHEKRYLSGKNMYFVVVSSKEAF